MMMIFIFLGIMMVGLALFAVVFMKEFKGGVIEEDCSLPLPDLKRPNDLMAKKVSLRESDVPVVPGMEKAASSDAAVSGGILGERYHKLEQMLEEKSRLLAQAEQELSNERSHRAEFESLKDILQRQIEDLKAQNRRSKEDLARALQDNADLVFKPSLVRPAEPSPEMPPVAPVPAPATEKFEQFFSANESGAQALSLHDIFENKPKL